MGSQKMEDLFIWILTIVNAFDKKVEGLVGLDIDQMLNISTLLALHC